MFTVDPKWMEFLKESGPKTFAVAISFGLFWFLSVAEILPPLNSVFISLVAFVTIVSGMLAMMSFLSALHRFFPINLWIVHYFDRHRAIKQIRDYIPYMTEDERKIVAYLLAHKQKSFTCDIDGGHAATLIGRGIVVRMMQPGQAFDQRDMPVTIPDHFWKIFEENKDKFPYSPPRKGDVEPHPWRVHWMAR